VVERDRGDLPGTTPARAGRRAWKAPPRSRGPAWPVGSRAGVWG